MTKEELKNKIVGILVMLSPIGISYLNDQITLQVGLIASVILAVALIVFEKELNVQKVIDIAKKIIGKLKKKEGNKDDKVL